MLVKGELHFGMRDTMEAATSMLFLSFVTKMCRGYEQTYTYIDNNHIILYIKWSVFILLHLLFFLVLLMHRMMTSTLTILWKSVRWTSICIWMDDVSNDATGIMRKISRISNYEVFILLSITCTLYVKFRPLYYHYVFITVVTEGTGAEARGEHANTSPEMR